MFTGIIQGMGRVTLIQPLAGEVKLSVAAQFDWDEPLVVGESLCVSGVCLTATQAKGREFSAHVSAETISRTILRDFLPGAYVNLERALRLNDRLGGHLVTGHVDGLGLIKKRQEVDRSVVFTVSLSGELGRYVVEKGSIAVDGVSLTVNQVLGQAFTVNIIPHTAASTTLGFKKTGDYVNLETDLIGKYVARFLGQTEGKSRLDVEFLSKHGYL